MSARTGQQPPRIILHTGKGGVGKTTLSAATAARIAASGLRALVVSTDPAHSLGDVLKKDLGARPGPLLVRARLWAEEIEVEREIGGVWESVGDYLGRLFASQGMNEVLAEELAVPPGAEELFALLRIEEAARSGDYDALVVDCAPTGATLRLLALPDVLRWYMEKLYGWQRRLLTALRPFSERLAGLPLPGDRVYEAVEAIFARVDRLHALLCDPAVTSVRLVTLPERMAFEETRRAFTQLSLFGYPVDAVLVNRVLPAEADFGAMNGAKRAQAKVLAEIERGFEGLRVLRASATAAEPAGAKALGELADELYGAEDPLSVFVDAPAFEVAERPEGPTLRLRLPFVRKHEVQVWTKDEELIVAAGARRRNWVLPRALAGRAVRRARLEGGVLEVFFDRERARRQGSD